MVIYRKSKLKITMLMLTCALVMTIGMGVLICIAIDANFKSASLVMLVNCIIFTVSCFIKIKPQYQQTLIVENKLIFVDKIRTCISFENIESIAYSGCKFVPMSEYISIKTATKVIYVDYNFNNYLLVWRDILFKCKEKNPELQVDPKLLKRIKALI